MKLFVFYLYKTTISNILSYWFYVDYTNIPLKSYLYLNST